MRLSSVLLLALLASVVNNWRRRLHDHYPPTAKSSSTRAQQPKLNDNATYLKVDPLTGGGRAGSVIAGGIPQGALRRDRAPGSFVSSYVERAK